MFAAAIYLRYSMKDAPRTFRIGKNGNLLMWLVGGLGFLGSLLAFVLSFIPPGQISTGSNDVWYGVMIGGCIIFVAIQFIIYSLRRPSWQDESGEGKIQPFHWEE